MNYQEYLLSEEWKEKRKIVIKRDWWKCRCCNSKNSLNVHHRTYSTIHTEEEINDLTLLCNKCHELIHSKTKIKKWVITHNKKKKKSKKKKLKNKEVSINWVSKKDTWKRLEYKILWNKLKINKSIWWNIDEFKIAFLKFDRVNRNRKVYWDISDSKWFSLCWYWPKKHIEIMNILKLI